MYALISMMKFVRILNLLNPVHPSTLQVVGYPAAHLLHPLAIHASKVANSERCAFQLWQVLCEDRCERRQGLSFYQKLIPTLEEQRKSLTYEARLAAYMCGCWWLNAMLYAECIVQTRP